MTHFLGHTKTEYYEKIVSDLLQNYHKMGVNMSLKIHFLLSYLETDKNIPSLILAPERLGKTVFKYAKAGPFLSSR